MSTALATTRTDALRRWSVLWAGGNTALELRYRAALDEFFGSEGRSALRLSPHTIRSYRFAVLEFFEFLASYRGAVVQPGDVARADALEYVDWLEQRGEDGSKFGFDLFEQRLTDRGLVELLEIYRIVRRGTVRFTEIAAATPEAIRRAHRPRPEEELPIDPIWLGGALRQLIQLGVLERDPKYVELRQMDPRAGLDAPVHPDTFRYLVVVPTPVSRATIAQRLKALSSFWQHLARGDRKQQPLVEYNVFAGAVERVGRGLNRERLVRSAEKTPDAALIVQLLEAADGPKLVNKRNVALLWFLVLTGARIDETLSLRRDAPHTERERKEWSGWLDRTTTPPTVVLTRKGNVQQRLPMPQKALDALQTFWDTLEDRASDDRESPAYRFGLLRREPDAPLYPPCSLWGVNRFVGQEQHGEWGYQKTLQESSVAMMLCRLSRTAGLDKAQRRRVHPHGFRHAYAQALVSSGRNLRELQAILGHTSVTTTEQYLRPEFNLEQLAGDQEVLSWLEKETGGLPRGASDRPVVVTTRGETPVEPPEVVVEGIEIEEVAEEEAIETVTLVLPPERNAVPGPVVAPDKPFHVPKDTDEDDDKLVALGEESQLAHALPYADYRDYEANRKPADLTWSSKPQSKWLEANYDSLPQGYAIGKQTLLVWSTKDAPLPWPVLSPGQAFPETGLEDTFLDDLEDIYDDWAKRRPTATLALSRWIEFLGAQAVGFDEAFGHKLQWAPFNAEAKKGEDLREHDREWLKRWFQTNADTFTPAQRRFGGKLVEPSRGESADDFWNRLRQDIVGVEKVPSQVQLPDWFMEADPVHALWAADPEEWKSFLRWLERLTGTSDLRREQFEHQEVVVEDERGAEVEQAREMLELYFSVVDEMQDGDSSVRVQRDAIGTALRDRFEIEAPTKGSVEDDRRRKERIDQIIRQRFPEKAPEPTGNVLGDARMFRPESFTIDADAHTIAHTAAFKKAFADENEGRDSECVFRRVARGLWEKVRIYEHRPAAEAEVKRKGRTAERRALMVTQLALLSYVVPCADEVEQLLARRGVETLSPRETADDFLRELQEVRAERMAGPELVALAQDVSDAFQVEPLEQSGSEMRRNAGRALPHPVRLLVATYWPV